MQNLFFLRKLKGISFLSSFDLFLLAIKRFLRHRFLSRSVNDQFAIDIPGNKYLLTFLQRRQTEVAQHSGTKYVVATFKIVENFFHCKNLQRKHYLIFFSIMVIYGKV